MSAGPFWITDRANGEFAAGFRGVTIHAAPPDWPRLVMPHNEETGRPPGPGIGAETLAASGAHRRADETADALGRGYFITRLAPDIAAIRAARRMPRILITEPPHRL